ncbi:hypothetical protein [Cytobacillus firmus]|uniref:hypothetical protein n=1 Tax=Cytobacillus firmus TaxID=1399 RepID=UPI0018CD5FFF|nr:hypothetical protein [Cytobacillus firmus]MBG9657068.1 hypothetical protein [Cytobacillus firmus]MED1906740.1 hypothetical protein [Cytobacillus firmus]
MQNEKLCLYCHNTFYLAKGKTSRYCSRDCYYMMMKYKPEEVIDDNLNQVRKCNHCGEDFQKPRPRKSKTPFFCSDKCKKEYREIEKMKKIKSQIVAKLRCRQCLKQFERDISKTGFPKGNVFCGLSCLGNYQSVHYFKKS